MAKTLEVKEVSIKDKMEKALEIPKLAEMKKIYSDVGQVVTKLGSIVVKTDADYQVAETAYKEGKELVKSGDKAYESATEQSKNWIKSVDSLYDFIFNPINLGLNDLKSRMAKFQTDQYNKRQKEIADLEAKKREAEKKIETADTSAQQAAAIKKVEKVEIKQAEIAAVKPRTVDRVRRFEIINPDEVERQYCTPEEKKIRPFIGKVDGPIPVIKGVRIWDEVNIVGR